MTTAAYVNRCDAELSQPRTEGIETQTAFSTQVIPAEHCPNVPGEACATLPVQDSWVNSIHHRPQAYASPQDVFKLLLTAKYSLLHLFLSDDLKYMFIFK